MKNRHQLKICECAAGGAMNQLPLLLHRIAMIPSLTICLLANGNGLDKLQLCLNLTLSHQQREIEIKI